MDKTTISVPIPAEVRDLMQRTWLDYSQKKDIVKGIIDDHKFDEDATILKSVVFKEYEKQCQECMVKYDAACTELTKKYVPEDIKDKNYKWNLEFDECRLDITVME